MLLLLWLSKWISRILLHKSSPVGIWLTVSSCLRLLREAGLLGVKCLLGLLLEARLLILHLSLLLTHGLLWLN